MATGTPVHMLDGYKVLDFTRAVAGPTASLMLAEMGAEVIKVEPAPDGDPTRGVPVMKDGRSGYFVQHNRGKKSICVDVRQPEGLAMIKDLLPQIDVLVENFSPGVMARLGLDYETVKAINPAIIMCSISAFGQSGPLSREPGYDTLGAAYAGIASMGGEADGPPYVPQAAIGDVSTGAHGALAICAALLYRGRTGRGQHLDISLLDTYFHYHEASVQMYSLSGGEINPFRAGSHSFYLDLTVRGDGAAGTREGPALRDERGSRQESGPVGRNYRNLDSLDAERRRRARSDARASRAGSAGPHGGRSRRASPSAATRDGANGSRPYSGRLRSTRLRVTVFGCAAAA